MVETLSNFVTQTFNYENSSYNLSFSKTVTKNPGIPFKKDFFSGLGKKNKVSAVEQPNLTHHFGWKKTVRE